MNSESTQEKIKQLRKKKGSAPDFSKALMGGYQCKEVDDYLSGLEDNAEREKQAYQSKLDEYMSEYNLITAEKEKLQKGKKEDRAKIEELSANLAQALSDGEALREENAGLESLAENLRGQIESMQKECDLQQNKRLSEENMRLTQQTRELIAEKQAQNEKIDSLWNCLEESKKENKELNAEVNSLLLKNKNISVTTNVKLYEFRRKSESNIDYASKSIRELIGIMDTMKKEAAEIFEDSNVVAQYEER